jgi:hypothetical protein
MAKHPKRPRDLNQWAAQMVALATGAATESNPDEGKDPAAVKRGRAGGLKGGHARALKLGSKQRKNIAKKAASARWKSKN